MAFCPQCRNEYVAGVTVCPDCEKELVEQLPPEEEMPDVEFVVLTEGQSEVVNEVLQAELEAANITSYVSGDSIQTMKVVPDSNVKVFVPKKDLELAQEILNEILTGPPLEEDPDLEGKFFCDACGAEVPADATVCPECGEPLENADVPEESLVCEFCGAQVMPDETVCPACGKRFEKK